MQSRQQQYAAATISGKQVAMLYARAREKGLRGWQPILEWLEFEVGIEVNAAEEIKSIDVDRILAALNKKESV